MGNFSSSTHFYCKITIFTRGRMYPTSVRPGILITSNRASLTKDFRILYFQINNFVSSALIGENNATVSTLTYSPNPADHGKLLSCQAFVEGLPGSELEDSRRLQILCKFFKKKCNLQIFGAKFKFVNFS